MKDLHQLLKSGQTAEALALLDKRIKDAPHDGELQLLKGVALFRNDSYSDAEKAFREALGLGLHTVTQAWKNLASICYRDRRFKEAIDFIAQYRELNPRDRESLSLHVSSLVELGAFAEAEREIEKYLEVFPDDSESLATMLFCLGLQGRYLELLAYSGRIPASAWEDQKILRAIAGALAALGLQQAARDVVHAAEMPSKLGSDEFARMSRYLGAERALDEHRFVDAIELYQSSIQADEEISVGLFNLSIACLAAGRLEDGWRLMRARTALFSMASLDGVPAWDGQSLDGKLLLVHSEQGIGDVIQFIRYLPLLEQAGVRVVFNAYPEILRLLCNDPRAKKLAENHNSLSSLEFDFQAQLLDLPAIMETNSVADIPAIVPYLYANGGRLVYWRNRLAKVAGLKVGLVWAGNPEHKQDHHRSARLTDFDSLAALPGVTWVILQKGTSDRESLSPPEGMQVIRLSDEIVSFDDTAAIIECLDLVISVDTSVAHLAGALNVPVWILLAESGKDWRWFVDIDRSPWYPSARLFTRPRETGWQDFIRNTLRPAFALWLLDKYPETDDWGVVRHLVRLVLGDGGGDNAPNAWLEAFGRLGINPLPTVRTLMLERSVSEPLCMLYENSSCDVNVESAWAEWLLQQGKIIAALGLWGAITKNGDVLPLSGFISWGGVLHDLVRYEEAAEIWNRALLAFPEDGHLHYMAGRTAQWAGLREAAVTFYEQALRFSPRHSRAHNNRGVLHEKDAPFHALASFQRAMLFDNSYVKPWQNATRVLIRVGASKAAALIMRTRCNVDESINSTIAFARALLNSGEEQEAKTLLVRIEGGNCTQDQGALLDRAFLYKELGDFKQCKNLLQYLVAKFPNDRAGHLFYGWQLLSEGKSKEGWLHYTLGFDKKQTVIPEWSGEPLNGRSLLIFQDQGMGDLFQFLHLVRSIPDQADVTLAVADSALALVNYQVLKCRVIALSAIDWDSSSYDFQIAQMKLPFLLFVDLQNPTSLPPYLVAPSGLLPFWERKCTEDHLIKVGIVWAGNPKYLNDSSRSTKLRDWLPLFELKAFGFYNLQKDTASNQVLAWDGLGLQNIAVDCDGWEKTANAIALLDLVITVDTGVAHLAAGLGKPTWVLLPHRGTDYRWSLEREDVPWYPQAKLFRQGISESWSDVLVRVKKQLSKDFSSSCSHA